MADAVLAAKAQQKTPDGYYNGYSVAKEVFCCAGHVWTPEVWAMQNSWKAHDVAPWTSLLPLRRKPIRY
jgi:hypothetical protein